MTNKPEINLKEIRPEWLARTYVCGNSNGENGREVKLTGRVAVQRKKSGTEVVLWEVCPLSIAIGSPKNTSFNKWVKPLELFNIMGDNKLAQMAEAKEAAERKLSESPKSESPSE